MWAQRLMAGGSVGGLLGNSLLTATVFNEIESQESS